MHLVAVVVAVAVEVVAVVPRAAVERGVVVRVQPRPVLARFGNEVVVVARPRLVGARRALVEVGHFDGVRQRVAVGVDGVDAVEVEDDALHGAAGDAAVHAHGLEEVLAVDERAPQAVGHHAAAVAADDSRR